MVEQEWMRAYRREMMGSFVVYALLLVLSIKFARPMSDGALRTALLMTPLLGFGLVIRAAARHFHRVDEYFKKFLLESTALAVAVTLGITFTYGFLETAGFPRLSMFVVWFIFCGAFAVVSVVHTRLNR